MKSKQLKRREALDRMRSNARSLETKIEELRQRKADLKAPPKALAWEIQSCQKHLELLESHLAWTRRDLLHMETVIRKHHANV